MMLEILCARAAPQSSCCERVVAAASADTSDDEDVNGPEKTSDCHNYAHSGCSGELSNEINDSETD